MTRTERLIDSSNNHLARALLHSAQLDEAPDNTAAKVALALGLGSTAIVTTVTTGAAASTGAIAGTGIAAGIGTAAPVVSSVTAFGMLKVMAIVSLTCGTLSYGGVKLALKVTEKPAVVSEISARPAVVSNPMRKPAAARTVASFAPEVAGNAPAPPPPSDDSDLGTAARGQEQRQPDVTAATSPRETSPQDLGRPSININSASPPAIAPRAPAERAATNPALPASPLPAARTAPHMAAFPGDDVRPPPVNAAADNPRNDLAKPAADLEREVALLDHARAALVAGQPTQALRELDIYRTQNPRGMLAAESVVLRVKALLALGQRSAAEREANPLLMAAPESRHADRLRELLGI